VSINTERLAEQIIDWESGRKEYYEEEFEHFTYRLESVDEEIEVGGHTLKFVDWVIRDSDTSLFVFSVDGELYALRGSVSSWGNSWDLGVFPVQPVTIVLETYEES
jgi:hypothetical protein